MGRPVHFEIHSSDPQRACDFYTSLLGWTVERWGQAPYWLVSTGDGPGINGAILARQGAAPADSAPLSAWVVTTEVADLTATLALARDLGAGVALEPMAIPGVGSVAYLKDPDGNLFGVLQPEAQPGS